MKKDINFFLLLIGIGLKWVYFVLDLYETVRCILGEEKETFDKFVVSVPINKNEKCMVCRWLYLLSVGLIRRVKRKTIHQTFELKLKPPNHRLFFLLLLSTPFVMPALPALYPK